MTRSVPAPVVERRSTSSAIRGGLPDPVAHRARRAAAGLPRQRRDLAEAGQVLDAEREVLRAAQRRGRTAARTSSPRRPPTRTRAPARRSPRSSARRADEIVFTKNATEAINLVAYALSNAATAGPEAARFVRRPRRRDRRHRDGAPRQPGALAAAAPSAPARRCAGSALPTTAGSTSSDLDELVNERTKVVALTHQSNMLGTVNPVDGWSRRAREVGALVAARRLPSRCRTCRSTSRARRRLPRVLRAQDARPDRHRRAVGPPRAARGDAAVPHRRLDDRGRPHGAAPRSPPPPQRFEAGVPMIAQAVGPRRRVSTTSPRSAWTRVAAHEHALTGYALERLAEIPGVRVVGPTDTEARGARCPSPSRASTRTTSARCSTTSGVEVRVGHHCAWPLSALRRAGDHPGDVLPLQRRRRRSTRSSTASGTPRSSSGEGRPDAARVDVPGDHPGPLPAPAPRGPARAVRRRGRTT